MMEQIVTGYDARRLIGELQAMGLLLHVGADGAVHGRMAKGKAIPRAAWALIDALQMVNEQAAELLKAKEDAGVTRLLGISPEECLGYGERVKSGQLRLVGKVVYHKAANTCDIAFLEVPSNE